MAQEDSERDGDFVHSLARGLAVIRAFGRDADRLTMSDIAKRTGLSRAAARRFLYTLGELGYVGLEGRHYRLRPKVLDLGYAYLASQPFLEVVRPVLQDLTLRLCANTTVGVLDGDEVVHVARVLWQQTIGIHIDIGARLPVLPTAMGRVLIAALPPEQRERFLEGDIRAYTRATQTGRAMLRSLLNDVAAQGYALVDQELTGGLLALAVPILDRAGQVVAALATTASAEAINAATMRTQHLPALRDASLRVTAALDLAP